MRYVIETECEHGMMREHVLDSTRVPGEGSLKGYMVVADACPGGSRRVVEPTTPDFDEALIRVVKAAKDMRRNGISLWPRLDFAVADKGGIQRLELEYVVKSVLDAALDGLVVIPDLG